MTEKELMQDKFIKWLQLKKYDFFRIGNAAFKKSSSYSYALDKDGRACHKYWPDLFFCAKGRSYMIEFGIPGANKNRKVMQDMRMTHWMINGGIIKKICYSWDDCQKIIDII